jgi:hypothetical protein
MLQSGRFFQATQCLSKTGISVEPCLLFLQQYFNVCDFTKQRNAYLRLVSPWKTLLTVVTIILQCGRFYQATECVPKTDIPVETCFLFLRQCFNVGDFTKQWNAYLSVETCIPLSKYSVWAIPQVLRSMSRLQLFVPS